jgi:hypothetical protein
MSRWLQLKGLWAADASGSAQACCFDCKKPLHHEETYRYSGFKNEYKFFCYSCAVARGMKFTPRQKKYIERRRPHVEPALPQGWPANQRWRSGE